MFWPWCHFGKTPPFSAAGDKIRWCDLFQHQSSLTHLLKNKFFSPNLWCHLKHLLNACSCFGSVLRLPILFHWLTLLMPIPTRLSRSLPVWKNNLIFIRATSSSLFFSQCVGLFQLFVQPMKFLITSRRAKTIPLGFWWLH